MSLESQLTTICDLAEGSRRTYVSANFFTHELRSVVGGMAFICQIATMKTDDETEGGLTNDDCFDTVQSLIGQARELVG